MKKILFAFSISSLFFTTSCLHEDDGAIQIPPLSGTLMSPDMGGANQRYQVWIDLSAPVPMEGEEDQRQKKNLRTAWDLAFYNGDEFRVILNYSIFMTAGSINSTNIDEVNEADFAMLLETFSPGAGIPPQYIDNIKGDYFTPNGTAIKEISANDAENKVYLVKLGYDYYHGNDIPPYNVYTSGDFRGYKKVRILRHGEDGYLIQYADLNSTSHQEFIIHKNPEYHFTFFSMVNESTVEIQPKKNNWDICFTVWNNVIEGYGTYIYPDFVLSNRLSGVGVYGIITDATNLEMAFNNFTLADVNEALFKYDDQRVIGSDWRSTVNGTSSSPIVHPDRFYVIKDPNGQMFKLRFLSMLGPNNERGFPKFEYDPL